MPIYEYECAACGHRYERMVKIGGDAPPCPECTSAEVKKLISRSGFILSGGGWYKDHYGLKSSSASGSETKAGSTSETKSEAKSETKPESKPSETKAAAAK